MQDYKKSYTNQYNKRTKIPTFQVNDRVLLKECRVLPGKCSKLSPKFTGPFKIIKKHNNFTYSLQRIFDGYIVKKKIHANRLKSYFDRKDMTFSSRDKETNGQRNRHETSQSAEKYNDMSDIFVAECLLRKRIIDKKVYFYVRWQDDTVTLEPLCNILDKRLITDFNKRQREKYRR